MLFTFYRKLNDQKYLCLILVSLTVLAFWLLVIQLGGAELDLKGKLQETRKRHGKAFNTYFIPRLELHDKNLVG